MTDTKTIYLDNSATTPISEAALDTYCRVSREHFGNPSSLHKTGLDAEHELCRAREAVMTSLCARGGRVIFLGSGSEANNLAIFGRMGAKARYHGKAIVTTAGEHASVGMPLARLKEEGFTVREVSTTGGTLDRASLEAALLPDTVLLTMMLVNNETGALYDVKEAATLMKARCPDAVLHCDATQAFLKIPFSPADLGADMVTVSAHKVGGPKGVGALWISDALLRAKGVRAHILGGGQEEGMRAGTENVPAIAAFGTACTEGTATLSARGEKLSSLRDCLLAGLSARIPEIVPLLPKKAAPHILTLCLPRIKSEVMLHFLSARGISVSSGSACSSHGRHGAHPLLAFGLDEKQADTCIRISFSDKNTNEDVDCLLDALSVGVQSLSKMK